MLSESEESAIPRCSPVSVCTESNAPRKSKTKYSLKQRGTCGSRTLFRPGIDMALGVVWVEYKTLRQW